jgi:formylglycine-generating enzyme required for sulfatase activity
MRAYLVVALAIAGCRGTPRDEAPSPATSPGSGTARTLPVTVSLDAQRPKLVDDLINVPAGRSRGREPSCERELPISAIEEPVANVEFSLDAYAIDRRVVSCVDYEACVASSACRALDVADLGCEYEHALVQFADAKRYCEWRGARLPTYREWQRAARGVEGRLYVTGKELDRAKACLVPAHRRRDGTTAHCEQTSSDGLVFTTHNLNQGEWTQTAGCYLSNGIRHEGPGSVYLLTDRLDLVSFQTITSEFRCARNR